MVHYTDHINQNLNRYREHLPRGISLWRQPMKIKNMSFKAVSISRHRRERPEQVPET
jgi:hypothetical protein